MNIYQRFDLDLEALIRKKDEREKAKYNSRTWQRMVSILNGWGYTVLGTLEKDFRGVPASVIVHGTANTTREDLSEKIRNDFYKAATEVGLEKFETAYSYVVETRSGRDPTRKTYKTEDIFIYKEGDLDASQRRGVIPIFPEKEKK